MARGLHFGHAWSIWSITRALNYKDNLQFILTLATAPESNLKGTGRTDSSPFMVISNLQYPVYKSKAKLLFATTDTEALKQFLLVFE
jgi:hypothetical protein